MERIRILVFLLAILLIGTLAGLADDFMFKIPPGWAFKNAALSPSGLKAIMLFQDVPYEGEASSRSIPSRILVLDNNNTILNDLSFPAPKHVLMTRDNHIILTEGIESTDNMTVLDSQGRPLFDVSTYGRRPYPALIGKEIGLAHDEIGDGAQIVGPISIIDGATGKEKISFGPPSGKGTTGYSGFLPIGENGEFMIASGATVCLRTYLHPDAPLWKIDDIGGNVRTILPVDESYVAIAYHLNDFRSKRFMAGIAILDRHDGKILFRQESHDAHVGAWKFLHGAFNVTLEEGDLFFTDVVGGEGIRVPRKLGLPEKWDIAGNKEYRITNWAKGEEATIDARHIVKAKKGVLQIAEIKYAAKLGR